MRRVSTRAPRVEIRRRVRADGSVSQVATVRYVNALGERKRLTCSSLEEAELERARLALDLSRGKLPEAQTARGLPRRRTRRRGLGGARGGDALTKEGPMAGAVQAAGVAQRDAEAYGRKVLFLTPAGRLADVIGRRRLFVLGVAGFTLARAACAAAPSVAVLVVARAAQGLAAAAMIPASLGMLLASTPPDRRKVAVGLWGAAASFAAAGPSLGGVLVDLTDWRSVFVINVPIGILALLGLRTLDEVRPGAQRVPDMLGTAALGVGIAAVVVGITKEPDWEWTSAGTLACLAGGSLLVAAVLARSVRHPSPAVEMDLWRSRTFSAANATSCLFGAGVYAWMLLAVITVTTFWDYSILEAGLAVSPGAVTAAVAAIAAGRIAERRASAAS